MASPFEQAWRLLKFDFNPEDIEQATAGDIIQDKLSTQGDTRGQVSAGPPRGPGDWRRPRGQAIRVKPNPPMIPGTSMPPPRRGRGSSEPSQYVQPRNTPLPPPRENTDREQFNYSRVPRRIKMPGEGRDEIFQEEPRRWLT